MTNTGLSDRDLATICSILAAHPEVRLVHLFGSRAKGNYQPGSDIDLAIMNAGVSDMTLLRIKAAFEESSLPYRVDMVAYPGLEHPGLKAHIDRWGTELYRRETLD